MGSEETNVRAVPCSTLQVTNVPLNTPDENLEELFTDYGPIKRCFVVKPKQPGAKKTLGIVQFAFTDDAEKAFKVRTIIYLQCVLKAWT